MDLGSSSIPFFRTPSPPILQNLMGRNSEVQKWVSREIIIWFLKEKMHSLYRIIKPGRISTQSMHLLNEKECWIVVVTLPKVVSNISPFSGSQPPVVVLMVAGGRCFCLGWWWLKGIGWRIMLNWRRHLLGWKRESGLFVCLLDIGAVADCRVEYVCWGNSYQT